MTGQEIRKDQKKFWRHFPKKRKHSGTEREITIRPSWGKARVYDELSRLIMTDDMYNVAVYSFWEWYNTGEGAGEENEEGWAEIPGGLFVRCENNTGICRVKS